MSDEGRPGDLPPDLPPEYAEAYRRAYERAYRELGGEPPAPDENADETAGETGHEEPEPPAERYAVSGPLFADEVEPADTGPEGARHAAERDELGEPTRVIPVGAASGTTSVDDLLRPEPPDEPEAAHRGRAPGERPAWLVPALLGAAVLLLLGAAFGVGKVLSSSVSGGSSTQDAGAGAGAGTSQPSRPKGKAYAGPVDAVRVRGARATCQAKDSVDAAGHRIDYRPRNVYDGDLTTAWRCNGDGVGQKLTLRLPAGTKVAEVGLVPGYAKTDPRSGADRYAQNNRITKVRWLLGDGTAVEQTFDGSSKNREMQTMRIPVTTTGRLVVEVLSSTPGPRRTIAVSEVRVGAPA